MIPKRPMMFFSCGDCSGSAPQGALICNPDYYALDSIVRVRLIGVGLGAQCQQFLKRADLANQGGIGFVFMGNDGQAFVAQAPELTLPYLNPAVSAVFPPDGSWSSLIVGTGSDPQAWRMMRAPSTGEKVVTTKDGLFMLKDPASSTGQTAVCYQDGSVATGNIVVCVKTGLDGDGFPVYGLSKLTVLHKHPVEGYIDPDTGAAGFRAIPSDKELTHPFTKFGLQRTGSYIQYDIATGNDDTGGIQKMPNDNTDPKFSSDAELVMFSPTTHKFSRLPNRVMEVLSVDTDVVVADNGSYVSMGGHAIFTNIQFNFPAFYISTTLRLRASGGTPSYNNVLIGLFIDGVLEEEFDLKNGQDVSLSYLKKNLALGQHTVDFRFKQTADADSAMTIKYSTTVMFSVL